MVGYYGFMLDVCVSVPQWCIRPYGCLYFVSDNNLSNINGFSPNLVCVLILWRSCLRLLMGKFLKILTELSAQDKPIFSFPDDNLSKCQGILTKLSTCIDINEIWFGIPMAKFCQCLTRVICPRHNNGWVLSFYFFIFFLFHFVF